MSDKAVVDASRDAVAVDYTSFETAPFPDAGEEDASQAPEWATDEVTLAAAFDIDDRGRRESMVALADGTRLHLIQQILVDWKTGTGVDIVLRGWLNRRTAAGRVPPGNPYTLHLAHALTCTTRKVGRTNPPIDFAPSSNGVSGFFVVSANLHYGQFQSEWYSARANGLTLHYAGAWSIRARGEPRDNPIDRVATQLLTRLSNGRRATPVYVARRGGA